MLWPCETQDCKEGVTSRAPFSLSTTRETEIFYDCGVFFKSQSACFHVRYQQPHLKIQMVYAHRTHSVPEPYCLLIKTSWVFRVHFRHHSDPCNYILHTFSASSAKKEYCYVMQYRYICTAGWTTKI